MKPLYKAANIRYIGLQAGIRPFIPVPLPALPGAGTGALPHPFS
jgi:hypothetical protein